MSIVKRLRSRVDDIVFPDELAGEAADEIERLNKKIVDLEHKVKLWVPPLYSGSGKTL